MSAYGPLFDLRDESGPEARRRVSARIGASICAFVCARAGRTFTAAELREHVARECGATAPASADRILRDCRQRGLVAYELVSRRDSLYRALPTRAA